MNVARIACLGDRKRINANIAFVAFRILTPSMGSLSNPSEVLDILDRLHVDYNRYELDCNIIAGDDIAYATSYRIMYFICAKSLLKAIGLLSLSPSLRKQAREVIINMQEPQKNIIIVTPRRCVAASMVKFQINEVSTVRIYIYNGSVNTVVNKMSQRISGKYTRTKLVSFVRSHEVFIPPIEYISEYRLPYMAREVLTDLNAVSITRSGVEWIENRLFSLRAVRDVFIEELKLLSTFREV